MTHHRKVVYKYKYIIYLIANIFFSIHVFSQNNNVNIKGYIVDSITQQKITNVNIVSINDTYGTTTNENGYFNFSVSIPAVIDFSTIGYKNKIIVFELFRDTSIFLQLSPKDYELDEISIGGENTTYNYYFNKFSVLDYNFIGENILVLQKQRSIGGVISLVLLNHIFDTLSSNTNLPDKSTKLFKDCLGSVHLLTNDSAYQIAADSSEIVFYKPHELNWFNQLLNNCLFKKNENIFFINTINRGFGHEIIYINETDKKTKLLIRYNDTENLSKLAENMEEISKYYFLHSAVNASTNDSATIKHIRGFNQEYRYISEIENNPIKNTISLVNDTIIYFNYYKSKLQLYTSVNELPIDISIDYNKTYGWGQNIIKDEPNAKLYSIIEDKSYIKIFEINYKNGSLDYITKLSKFNYEEIKINNGYVYYLNNLSSSRYHIRKLSRIKI